MSSTPDLRDEAGSKTFSILPNELFLKVLGYLTIAERLEFATAFPQFEAISKDPGLFKRTLTVSDMNRYKDPKDLKEVLDPNGTAIQVSLEHNKTRHLLEFRMILDIFDIMQHLQELTLCKCHLYIGSCSCRDVSFCKKQCVFLKDLMSRPKVLNLDSCVFPNNHMIDSTLSGPARIWYDLALLHEKHINKENFPRQSLEVTLLNTLPIVHFGKIRYNWIWSNWCDDRCEGLRRGTPVEVENLKGEVVNLTKFMRLGLTLAYDEWDRTTVQVCHRAFYKIMGWDKMLRERFDPHHRDPCSGIFARKVRIRIGRAGILGIRLTEDFDMDEFKRELDHQYSRLADYEKKHRPRPSTVL